MKIKELREILSKYPDDMEVLNFDDVSGPFPMQIPKVETLELIQYHEWNGRPHEYQNWSFPSNYPIHRGERVKTEECLIFWY